MNAIAYQQIKKNTKVSLLKVCSIMIEEEGNPKMKQIGRDLEQGRWCCTRVGEHRLHTDFSIRDRCDSLRLRAASITAKTRQVHEAYTRALLDHSIRSCIVV